MTLAAQLTSDRSVFLNTSDFATSITHYPAGDYTAGVSVTAVVDYDTMDESAGDGSGWDVNDEHGVSIRQVAKLEISSAVTVTETPGKLKPSIWLIDSVRWVTIRVIAKDADFQTVLITRLDEKMTRRTKLVP